jgi:hypothetical protein
MPVGSKKRQNIVDLRLNYPEKFGRFIMALKNLINSADWARICGIHGNTFMPGDVGVYCPTDVATVTKIACTGEPFYCKHGVYSARQQRKHLRIRRDHRIPDAPAK